MRFDAMCALTLVALCSIPACSDASYASFDGGPPRPFDAILWQQRYAGPDPTVVLNGTLTLAEPPLSFLYTNSSDAPFSSSDVCDATAWWPLDPELTPSLSLIALITSKTVYSCGGMMEGGEKHNSNTNFLAKYKSAGFIGVVWYAPLEPFTSSTLVISPDLTSADDNFQVWVTRGFDDKTKESLALVPPDEEVFDKQTSLLSTYTFDVFVQLQQVANKIFCFL